MFIDIQTTKVLQVVSRDPVTEGVVVNPKHDIDSDFDLYYEQSLSQAKDHSLPGYTWNWMGVLIWK